MSYEPKTSICSSCGEIYSYGYISGNPQTGNGCTEDKGCLMCNADICSSSDCSVSKITSTDQIHKICIPCYEKSDLNGDDFDPEKIKDKWFRQFLASVLPRILAICFSVTSLTYLGYKYIYSWQTFFMRLLILQGAGYAMLLLFVFFVYVVGDKLDA